MPTGISPFPRGSTPPKERPEKSTVAIVHRASIREPANNYGSQTVREVMEMIKEGIELVLPDGIRSVVHPGDKVVIKVNAFFPYPPERCVSTDPRVVEALITLIRKDVPNVGAIRVVEDPACFACWPNTDVWDSYEVTGIGAAAKRAGAELVDLEQDTHIRVDIPAAKALPYFYLPKTISDADCYILVPKMKTHESTFMTGAIKLQQGIFNRADKDRAHALDLSQKLVDTLKVAYPDLVIIDALSALQGNGPLSLREEDLIRDSNVLIVGKDPVATDAVMTAMAGFHPFEVWTTEIAHNEGLGVGDLERIDIRGTPLDKVRRQFVRPSFDIYAIPNLRVYQHGGCIVGCMGITKMTLDPYVEALKKLREPINVIMGFKTWVPDQLFGPTIVIGDCAEEHKSRATKPHYWIPGCPDPCGIFWQVPKILNEIIEESEAKYAKKEDSA